MLILDPDHADNGSQAGTLPPQRIHSSEKYFRELIQISVADSDPYHIAIRIMMVMDHKQTLCHLKGFAHLQNIFKN